MIKKILYSLVVIILVVTVIINVLSISGTSFMGFRVYRVASGSMDPYLKINNLILVKASNNYKKNDVITYQSGSSYVTHRIIKINDNEVITKGDANNTQDDPITKDKIVGKLIYRFRLFGLLVNVFNKPITWVIALVTGFLVIYLVPNKKNN